MTPMDALIQAAGLKQQLDQLRPIAPEQEMRIMQKFRLDWNYHSNNLEGNSLTYGETKALLMFGITAQGKPLKDHFEVTGHNEAIEWVTERVKGDYPLTQNFIRELHTLLLKEPYQVNAQTPDGQPTKKWIKVGEYKSSPNHVETKTGEIFYFATPEETPAKMTELLDWYTERAETHDLNPILLAAEFHYKFIRIHPFDDGNGRTARIIMNFILMKFGYPPVIIKTEDKANYFAALQLADSGQIEAFVDYIAENLVRSLEIMIAGAKGESIEEPDDIDKEIALLDRRIISFGNRRRVVRKSKANLKKLIGEYLPKLYKGILDKYGKLNKYYDFVEIRYLVAKIDEEDYELFNEKNILNHVDEIFSAKKIVLQIIHNRFKEIPGIDFGYFTEIVIRINDTSYSLYDEDGKNLALKFHENALSDDEIRQIAINETKRHINALEQKIAEKENGKL